MRTRKLPLLNLLRLLLLFAGTGFAYLYHLHRLSTIEDTFDTTALPRSTRPAPSASNREFLDSVTKQTDLRTSWALAMLGGLVALTIKEKTRALSFQEWFYIVLGPAAGLLCVSLQAGIAFQARLSYAFERAILQNAGVTNQLIQLLSLQGDCLTLAFLALTLFAGAYLTQIVWTKQ